MPEPVCDPFDLHARAWRIRQHAGAVRDRAAALVHRTDALQWHSTHATALRDGVRATAVRMRAAADRLDEAAAVLDAHANRLDAVLSGTRIR